MADKRLASLPQFLAYAEILSGVLFIAGFVTQPRGSVGSWLGLAAGLFLVVGGARTAVMEVRHIGEVLRVVNTYRSHDIRLTDIEAVLPDQTLPGALRLQVAGTERPVRIDVTPRNRDEREALRRAILEAVRNAAAEQRRD